MFARRAYARPPTCTANQLQLDQDIANHLLAITQLSTQRNSESPVSRLPNEILASIFAILKSDAPQYGLGRWIRFAAVCHHWRQVALGFPRLFSSIDISHQSAEYMLQRSHGALLKVACLRQPYNHQFGALGTYIMSQIARIEELSLDFTSLVVVSQLLSTNSGASADKLRVLRLRRRGIEHIANPLPRGIFARDMRNLRHLQLEAFPLSEALPCFPHLTKLDIDGKKSFMPTPLAVLLASLEKNPSITSLTLDQVEQSGPQSAVNGDLLALPNLSELRVYTVYAHNRPAIFQYLTVPPDCTVRISWQGQVPTPFSSAFTAMEPVFRNALQNSSREIHSFGLVESEGHLRLSLHSGLEEPMFDTAMNASSIADTSVRRIISLLASPRMSSARMIALVLSNSHILPSMGISDWSPLIARLDNLRELDLSFVGGLFFDLMSKEISGGSIPLPLLETLVFKELDWVSAPPLIEALQARSAAGLRLNELRLFDSVISPSMVEVLKELTNLSLS